MSLFARRRAKAANAVAATTAAAAPEPPVADSIVELISALVATPSRAGVDPLGPVLKRIEQWFTLRGLPHRRLVSAEGMPLGLHAFVDGRAAPPHGAGNRPHRHWVLNATLDTAGYGDLASWTSPPDRPHIDADGWLHGRGSADSKAGVAVFAHLFDAFFRRADSFDGSLSVLFDLDEHTGGFAGARRYFDAADAPRVDGVFIGYPGIDRIVVGARGFLRARLVVHGIAAHSGGSTERGLNAVERAAKLVIALHAVEWPADALRGFERPPQLTVTALHGGTGYSQVPDRCELSLDVRLTPAFDADRAKALIHGIVAAQDRGHAPAAATDIEWIDGWPAYRVADDDPMVRALRDAARVEWGRDLPLAVVGPSNIGNYLARKGIPALCGFGVRAENLHAADERMDVATVAPVYRVYEGALRRLLAQ